MLTVSLFSYRERKSEAQKVNILDNHLPASICVFLKSY